MLLKIGAYVIIFLIIIVWIASPNKTNPPVTAEIEANTLVKSILKRACYDCHSNNTNWPWYSYIPPISLLVGNDVVDGRNHLNFTDWDKYSDELKIKKLSEIIVEIEKGKMPLKPYVALHSEAKLTPQDIKIIKNWIAELIAKQSNEIQIEYRDDNHN